jgi:hypothetical protein
MGRVSEERIIAPAPSLNDLARMAAEEELKRRLASGGGGGGSSAMKSPTQFVLYSMSLINEQMRAMYQAVIAAFDRNQANTPQVQQNTQANPLPLPVREVISNIATALRMINESLQRGSQQLAELGKSARELGSNALSAAILSMSGWVSRTLKLLGLASADDDNFEAEELAEKQGIAEEQINLTTRLFGDGESPEANGRSVISHIQNVADQMNRVVASLLRRD